MRTLRWYATPKTPLYRIKHASRFFRLSRHFQMAVGLLLMILFKAQFPHSLQLEGSVFVPFKIDSLDYFYVFDQVPRNFGNYEIKKIDEKLESSERKRKYMIFTKFYGILPKAVETSRTFKFKTEYLCVKNVIVSGLCIFGRGHILISVKGINTPDVLYPVNVLRHVHSAIVLCHYRMTFGCPYFNFFFIINAFPDDVIRESVVVFPKSNMTFAEEIYNTCYGYQEVIQLDENEYIQADVLHTVIHPTPGISHFATGCYNFSLLFRRKFKLTSIIPTEYALCNRDSKYARHINNFNDVVEAVRSKLSSHKWMVLNDEFNTTLEAAKAWARIKVILAPTGSNMVKCIAMAPCTAICCLFGNRFDWEVVAITQAKNIFIYVFPVPGMSHYEKESENLVDLDLVVHVLNDTVYAAENGKWKGSTIEENDDMRRSYELYPG